MTVTNEQREELLALYNNAAQNLSELKKHSYHILVSASALLGFIFVNWEYFEEELPKCFLSIALFFGLLMCIFLYYQSRMALEKHRDRIGRIKAQLSTVFQHCYKDDGPGPGRMVDVLYLLAGICYLILIFSTFLFLLR